MQRILTMLAICALALAAIAAPAQEKAAKKGAKDRPGRVKKAGGDQPGRVSPEAAQPRRAKGEGDQPGRAKAGGGDQPVRVLLTVGGHSFNEPAFYAMLDALKGIKYDKITLPAELDKLKPGLEKQYDVLVLYDQMKKLTTQQQDNLIALLKTGIGVVSVHHEIGANSGWDEWAKVLGALYIRGPRVIDGVQYTKAVSTDGQTFNVHVADPDHFITKGLKDFTIEDEAYDKYYLDPKVHVLLTTEHPKNKKEMAWTWSYGKSPVFYMQFGHDEKAYDNPAFRHLLSRGIVWAARERQVMAGAKLEK